MRNLNVVHLILLHKLDGNAEKRSYGGTYLADGAKIVSHEGQYLLKAVLLFVFERMEVHGTVDHRTEDMAILFVIVKLDVDLEG